MKPKNGSVATNLTMSLLGALSKNMDEKSKLEVAPNVDGLKVLKHGKIYGAIGWALIVFCLAVEIGIFLRLKNVSDQPPFVIFFIFLSAFFMLFILLGMWMVLSGRNMMIRYDDDKIEGWDMYGAYSALHWKDVTSVSFGTWTSTIVLKGNEQKIKAGTDLIGAQGFIDAMKRNVDPSRTGPALEKMERMKEAWKARGL